MLWHSQLCFLFLLSTCHISSSSSSIDVLTHEKQQQEHQPYLRNNNHDKRSANFEVILENDAMGSFDFSVVTANGMHEMTVLPIGHSYNKNNELQDNSLSQSVSSWKVFGDNINPPSQHRFPSMALSSKGGVVFFLHIPKTGGTTLRRNLEHYDHINYIFAKNYSVYWDTAPVVEEAIVHGTPNRTILFYEVHANTSPSFFRLRNRLARWKETAKQNNVPVFFFTVLREPLAFAFSHFNFFHVQRRNPTFEQCNATTDNFLRLSLQNPQCQFLFKGEPSLRAQKPKNRAVRREDCIAVRDSLFRLMDWIGTTERLSNETMAILSNVLDLPTHHTWESYRVSKEEQDVYFGRDNVTSDVLDTILDMSYFDAELHRMASSYFEFDSAELKNTSS
jgi:hypothetical protein